MYYITNHNNQVIAASSDLLEKLEVKSIDILYKQIALDNIEFSLKNNNITLKTPLNETTYQIDKEILSSILGVDMTLVHLISEISDEDKETVEVPTSPTEDTIDLEDDFSLFEDKEPFIVKEENDQTDEDIPARIQDSILSPETDKEENTDMIPLLDDEELFSIKEESNPTELDTFLSETENDNNNENDDDLFELVLPENTEKTLDTIENKEVDSNTPVYINVEQTAQSIGISSEDYNSFLKEYIDTALSLEEDLRSNEQNKRTAAIHTLFHLSNVLRIPVITEIIEQLKYTETEDINNSIQSFYDTLNRLTTSQPEIVKSEESETISETDNTSETTQSFGTIDLSEVKPIHFDFRVEEAADDLSLPTELIEEFIHDFIKQAHEETDKMLQAYEKGDLDTIQKIGHLLKGTASNLRINPLSDTLYEIQFCDDPSKLDALIKEYWAHFIAFETQFNLTSQH